MAKLRSVNPANGEVLGDVKIATKAEIETGVNRAKKAFLDWKKTDLAKRAKILIKLADLLEKNQEKLAKLVTKEMGKPLVEARGEVEDAAGTVRYFVEEGKKVLKDEVLEPRLSQAELKKMDKAGVEDAVKYLQKKKGIKSISLIRYDPVGVIGVIKLWNYPLDVPLVAISSALLTGNCVLFKPAEEVPLISQELARLVWQAGVPIEVFQVLQGRAQVGAMLVDTEIDMVNFTGSSEVGQEIAGKCGKRLIKFCLEMGGSSPALVLRDADLELAANGVLYGRFVNCGQVCNAIKRVIVEKPVAEKFTKMLAERVEALRVGDPMEAKVDIGPLASEKQLKKFEQQVTKGVIQGGRIIVGGRRLYDEPYNKGWFHEPTLMVYVQPRNIVMQEEVFGPMLAVCQVENLNQAIKTANNNPYGLTAAVFTKSKLKAEQVERKVEAGSIYVNEPMAYSCKAPWTGLKLSGFGVEGSKHGLWEMVNKKHVYYDLTGEKGKKYWLPY